MVVHAPYTPCGTDAERRRWMDVVVMLLARGATMADAMTAARQIVRAARPEAPRRR